MPRHGTQHISPDTQLPANPDWQVAPTPPSPPRGVSVQPSANNTDKTIARTIGRFYQRNGMNILERARYAANSGYRDNERSLRSILGIQMAAMTIPSAANGAQ